MNSENVIFTFGDYEEKNGTRDNDFLIGTDGNDWIMGNNRFLGRFHDGYDYLFPKNGNDIIIGGPVNTPFFNDQFVPNNIFIDGNGFKTIIGFSSISSPSYRSYLKKGRYFIDLRYQFYL